MYSADVKCVVFLTVPTQMQKYFIQ